MIKGKGIIVANPIPYEFFRTSGTGESQHQIHAGSYHDAMRNAGIELGNLMMYTSILPKIATEVPKKEGIKRITHGAEVKIIQAVAHVDREKDEVRATSAILYGFLIPKGKPNAPHEGGLVCEYNGEKTVQEALENLRACLNDLYDKPNPEGIRFSDKYDLQIQEPLVATIEPTQRYGTALTALVFVSHFVPIISTNLVDTETEKQIAKLLNAN